MIVQLSLGKDLVDIPKLDEIRSKIAQKRNRGDYADHYFADVELVLISLIFWRN